MLTLGLWKVSYADLGTVEGVLCRPWYCGRCLMLTLGLWKVSYADLGTVEGVLC